VTNVSLEVLEKTGALTPVSLTLPARISQDEYEALGTMLGTYRESLHWAIGDWLAYGERRWGEESYQLSEALGISAASRLQYVRVASLIAPERRRQRLSWTHHRHVAQFDPDTQTELLQKAIDNGWSKRELGDAVAELKGRDPKIGRMVVIEAVAEAAEKVWFAAVVDGDSYKVPAAQMLDLAHSLGVEDDG
jgi:hypothetical protein